MYLLSRLLLILVVLVAFYSAVLMVVLGIALVPEHNRGPVIAIAIFVVGAFINIKRIRSRQ